MNTGVSYTSESDAITRLEASRLLTWFVFRTGENYTEDGSEVSEATYRPQVVHLGQYVSNVSVWFHFLEGLTVLSDLDADFKPIRCPATNVTNNGLFGSTGLS